MTIENHTNNIHPSAEELAQALDWVRQSPKDSGQVEMIIARPGTDQRVVVQAGELRIEDGLAGDNWLERVGGPGAATDSQITIINARAAQAITRERERWPLAGDQLVVDLDISQANLVPGDRLQIGDAVLEITALPHNGCAKFTSRFGHAAIHWVNSPAGREMRLRGVYARVIKPGLVQVGESVLVKRS